MISAPALLNEQHDVQAFSCGVASLDEWLQKRALQNQRNGASRTYIVTNQNRVIGYYCLASGGLALTESPKSIRRNMPDPIPIAILGRLAVDVSMKGHGLGAALLQDAVFRCAQAAGILGIRGILVHALSEDARQFYLHHGFVESPTQPMMMLLSLKGLMP
jgi:GNAT superfamily N-acetyltransferase